MFSEERGILSPVRLPVPPLQRRVLTPMVSDHDYAPAVSALSTPVISPPRSSIIATSLEQPRKRIPRSRQNLASGSVRVCVPGATP